MKKNGCLGQCPVYDLRFYADGTIEFDGKYNVVAKGRRWVRSDPELLKAALAFDFGVARWRELPEHGTVECTDQPSVTFEYDARRVEHDYGDSHAPGELTQLEYDLDRLGNVKDLVGDYALALPEGSYCYDTKTIYLAP